VRGNLIFLIGASLELIGLQRGVSTWAVAVSLLTYGALLLYTGYNP